MRQNIHLGLLFVIAVALASLNVLTVRLIQEQRFALAHLSVSDVQGAVITHRLQEIQTLMHLQRFGPVPIVHPITQEDQ